MRYITAIGSACVAGSLNVGKTIALFIARQRIMHG